MKFHTLTKEEHLAEYGFDDMLPFMEILTMYALKVESILEIGTRTGQSTTAFILGAPASIACCDYERSPSIEKLEALAKQNGVDFRFIHANSGDLHVVFKDKVDLVFIDGEHSYKGATRDLNEIHEQTQKYILLHDHIYWPGVKQAVDEFLPQHPEWRILEQFDVFPGLLVLERV